MVPESGCNSNGQIILLYVDDEAILLNVTKQYLERTGNIILHTASSAKEGLQKIHEEKYDAVVSDYQMPEMDGLAFLKTLRDEGNQIPFIIFTGRGREEVAIEALNAGADFYLQKGGKPKVQFGELQNFVRQAVDKNRAEKQLLEYEQKMANVINFMPDATFAVNTDGRVIAWNRAIEQMTGTPASEMLGKGDYESAIPFYGKRCPILADVVLNKNVQTKVSYPVQNSENRDKLYAENFIPSRRNGEGAYLWFTASPLYDTDGSVTGAIESIRDITDYKQAEGIYKTIFENTGTAMVILDNEVTISYANEEMEHLLGFSGDDPEFFLNWQKRVAEEDREYILKCHQLRRTDPDNVPKSYDCRLIHRNGEQIDVKLTSAMIPGTKKNIVSFIDITAQKKAEKKLKFTQFTMDHAPDAIFWVDFKGNFISVNKKAVEIFGYSEEELLGMGLSMFIPHFQTESFQDYWDKTNRKKDFIFEIKTPKKDGGYVSTEISVVTLKYDGQKYGCAFVRDISERKKVKAAQNESDIKFREIFNSASDVMFLNEFLPGFGLGKFLEFNDATCRDLGYGREELFQLSMADILLPEFGEQYEDIVKQYRAKGRASFEVRAKRKDGSIVSFETNTSIFQLNDKPVHLSVGRDISERKNAENALKNLNKKLNLLSSITRHDISNQICVLLGYEEILEGEDDKEKAEDYLREIIGTTEMIQNQIAFTSEYQELGIHSPSWQSVEYVVRLAVSNVSATGLQVGIETGKLEIFADHLLEKVFYNLFENAVRHGDHVTEIRVSFYESEGDGVLAIEDNGIGVADDMKEKIFDRGVGSNTGFGLFLTREILDITGISISEIGTEGKGARFEITVPKYGYRFKA